MQPNPIVWWELASSDARKSAEFFEKALDWQIEYDENLGFFRIPVSDADSEFSESGPRSRPTAAVIPIAIPYLTTTSQITLRFGAFSLLFYRRDRKEGAKIAEGAESLLKLLRVLWAFSACFAVKEEQGRGGRKEIGRWFNPRA